MVLKIKSNINIFQNIKVWNPISWQQNLNFPKNRKQKNKTKLKRDVTESVRCECLASIVGTPTNTPEKNQQSHLTELVADALVVQQRRVLKGVPAVEDAGVGAHRRDATQRQHGVVDQQRGRLLPESS